MLKDIYKTIILTVVACIIMQVSNAQIPIFNYTDTPPVIDGVVDAEWSNHASEDISNNNQGTVSSDTDLSASYKITWDNSFLYLLVEVSDDVVHSDDDASVWQDDCLEVYFDIGNDKLTSYGIDDYQYQFRYNDNQVYEAKYSKITNVDFDQTSTSGSVIYEVAFPWSTLGTIPTDSIAFGLDIMLNDNDNTGGREGKLAWFAVDQDNTWSDPSLMGTAKLGSKPKLVKCEKPTFSHKRGYYTDTFTLSLSATAETAVINYTLDGSDPRFSTTTLSGTAPLDIKIDPSVTVNRGGSTPGVVVRSFTSKDGFDNSDVKTHTYLFLSNIKTQGVPGGIWPATNTSGGWWYDDQNIYYPMNSTVVNASAYADSIDDAFEQIPTVSIVSDNSNIFGDTEGIYMHASSDGKAWERPASVELINPNSSDDFQIDAGIRIRGGYSRIPSNPKHSFRLFFRKEYGESKLRYSMFGNEGADEFDKIDFRTSQNYSWAKDGSDQNTMLKDVSFRDIQGKMGHPYTRSRYYHLFVNGMYWGIYQTQERSEARFAATYMGGDAEDYDVVKPERDFPNDNNNADDLKVVATDGTMDAFTRLYNKTTTTGFSSNAAYFEVQGMNADGTRNTSYERLIDVENLIDYLAITFYSGSYDAPVGQWGSDVQKGNNYFGIYNKNNPDGFKWFVHDFEHSMNGRDGHSKEGGLDEDWVIKGANYEGFQSGVEWFNPLMVHYKMMENDEYKIKFADRVYKHFSQGGLLSPDSVLAVWNKRQSQIDVAIIAESARWGSAQRSAPRTKNDDWLDYINYLKTNYFPYRTAVVLQDIKDIGLYPSINPPNIRKGGVDILTDTISLNISDNIQMVNSNGTTGDVYYTTDGSDPRAIGGNVGVSAINGDDDVTITITTTTVLKTRVLNGSTWSPLNEVRLSVADPLSDLRVTEVHYNPIDQVTGDGSELEFIEFKNTGTESINLTGVALTNGIDYVFETKTLAAGEFAVLASNKTAFYNEYGFHPDGEYMGALKNSGEKVTLRNAVDTTVISFTYSDELPWPVAADGLGNSLVSVEHNPTGDPDDYTYWRASSLISGSPGADDPASTIAPIMITEILSHSDYPNTDAIELYNPTASSVDLSYWYLTDDKKTPRKYQIPSGTSIAAMSYLTINEGHFVGVDTAMIVAGNEFGSAFSISSHGEDVYLLSADVNTDFTGYSTGIGFGEIETDVTFGIYENSIGEPYFVAQEAKSLGAVNGAPRVGPLVFNQIMYHPDEFNYEFVEIVNTSAATVNLWATDNPSNTWKINGIGFKFPENVSVASGASIFIIEDSVAIADFRAKYSIDAGTQVFNMGGKLSNDGENIQILKPAEEYVKNYETTFEYILIEEVRYNDKAPWSINADGNGTGLARIDMATFANDPANWADGSEIAPSLTADATDNDIEHDIDIEFTDDAVWRAAVTSVSVNGIALDAADYSLTAGNLFIASSAFPTQADYIVAVDADEYYRSSVIQEIVGTTPPPSLSADNVGNYINENHTITFSDNADWRSNILKVKIDGEEIDASTYSVSAGELTIDGSLFPVDYTYNISVSSYGYLNAQVDQEVKAYEIAPALIADNTENYTLKQIDITYADDADWRNAINEVLINDVALSAADYNVSNGTISFNAQVFELVGNYEVKVTADFYNETVVAQQIVQAPVSINNNIAELNLKVYPNPSSGIFNVLVNDEMTTCDYKVLNMLGQVIDNGTIYQTEFSIDLRQYSGDMFILLVHHDKGTTSTRLIKR